MSERTSAGNPTVPDQAMGRPEQASGEFIAADFQVVCLFARHGR